MYISFFFLFYVHFLLFFIYSLLFCISSLIFLCVSRFISSMRSNCATKYILTSDTFDIQQLDDLDHKSSKGPDLLGSSEASRPAGWYNAKFDKPKLLHPFNKDYSSEMALYQPARREASDDPRRSGPLLDALVWLAKRI